MNSGSIETSSTLKALGTPVKLVNDISGVCNVQIMPARNILSSTEIQAMEVVVCKEGEML